MTSLEQVLLGYVIVLQLGFYGLLVLLQRLNANQAQLIEIMRGMAKLEHGTKEGA